MTGELLLSDSKSASVKDAIRAFNINVAIRGHASTPLLQTLECAYIVRPFLPIQMGLDDRNVEWDSKCIVKN